MKSFKSYTEEEDHELEEIEQLLNSIVMDLQELSLKSLGIGVFLFYVNCRVVLSPKKNVDVLDIDQCNDRNDSSKTIKEEEII